jgi:signal peptidase
VRRQTASARPRSGRALRAVPSLTTTALLLAAVTAVAVPAAGRLSGRWQLLPILSGSMAPAIRNGSLVLATRAPLASVREGDVIVYHIPIGDHHLTTHRVVAVVHGGAHPVVRTKGDANTRADPWKARLDGPAAWKVSLTLPFLGYAALLMREPWIAAFAIGLLGITVLLVALRRLWRHDRRPRASGHVAARH